MGRTRMYYYQVVCDYPAHKSAEPDINLAKGEYYHFLANGKAVCGGCWDNRMTVESLLDLLNIEHKLLNVDEVSFAGH